MSWFSKKAPQIKEIHTKDMPDNLWFVCKGCHKMIYHKDVVKNHYVCSLCDYHFYMPMICREKLLFDEGVYQSVPLPRKTKDVLGFKDLKSYPQRLKEAQKKTNDVESVRISKGLIHGKPSVVLVFNFNFIGGSMGFCAGEAIVHCAEIACQENRGCVILSASGGARMQEGIFSLMQMPRSVAALLLLGEKKLPFVSVLTHPTTGGVAASFASLGDLILAEPDALIGFTGERVIRETTGEKLPPNFQCAQEQANRGMLDRVVHRKDLKKHIGDFFNVLMD